MIHRELILFKYHRIELYCIKIGYLLLASGGGGPALAA